MSQLNANKSGLAIGIFYALGHLGWVGLVAAGLAKPLLDWILSLHFFVWTYEITPFALGPAVVLIAFTFVCGYVTGWVFAALWNVVHR